MSREVLKVFCPEDNQVGRVVADTDGYAVEYTAAVLHINGILFGSDKPVIDRLTTTEEGRSVVDVAPRPAFCRRCKRPVTIYPQEVWGAVMRGADGIKQPFTDVVETASDQAWQSVGREPLFSPNKKWKRRDPRGKSDDQPPPTATV